MAPITPPPVALSAGDIIEMKVYSRQNGQEGINAYHYRVTAFANTTATAGDLANSMDAVFRPLYITTLAANASFQGVGIRFLQSGLWSVETLSTTGPVVGTAPGDPLPLAMCGIATKKTRTIGRAGRGRVYFAFPTENYNTSAGAPTAGYQSLMEIIMDQYLDTGPFLAAGGLSVSVYPILFHRSTGTYTDIIGMEVRDKWATQHRRGDYGRLNSSPF